MKTEVDHDHLRGVVADYIEKAKLRNSRFSLRGFAAKLEVSAGNLSQFLAGKRNFSAENVKKIVHLITDNPEERKNLLERINRRELEDRRRALSKASTSVYESTTLSEEEFAQLDEWYYYAVRTVLSLKEARYDTRWIAEQLGIPEAYAEKALTLLLKFGLVRVTSDGRIERTKKHLMTPDSVKKNPRIDGVKRRIHAQHLEHARKSLEVHGPDVRDITWVNIPANPKKLDQAREIIRKCQDDILALLEDEATTEVYRLTIQLCPMKT
jgi:uncharacterized protein (TIGR02147 family)